MKHLFLLRHAKSSWNDPAMADFDRPLNDRGLAAAPFMGEVMARKEIQPGVIISSPANRAMQTAILVKEASGSNSPLQYDERIYEASPQNLLSVASQIPENFASALLVGHNPGMGGFIHHLTGRLEPMPTAALAMIELDIDRWLDLTNGCGILQAVYRPKDELK